MDNSYSITIKKLVKLFTPPVIINSIIYFRKAIWSYPEWEYINEGWDYMRTHPEVKGWNVKDVLEVYKKKWPIFLEAIQGTGVLGIIHESSLENNTDIRDHNTIMTFAYVFSLTARNKDKIKVLDWGGGIGHYYLIAKKLQPDIEIQYYCKDLPLLSEYGANLFPEQHFYSNDDCLENIYDFVFASTSIHYYQDWRSLLSRLSRATSNYLYIANLPTVFESPSFVFVQRPYRYGYNTEYLSWCLNRTEFLESSKQEGLKLIREFTYGHQPYIKGAPEQNTYRGYLFQVSCFKNNAEGKNE